MINQKQLLKTIIKKIILTERFLTEAPIDVWKNKNKSLSQQQISQAETYFAQLTTKLNALLHPITKDLTTLSFQQLENLFKTVETAREKNLAKTYIQWLTKQLKQKNLNLQQIIEDYIPPLFSLQKNKDKFEPDVLDKLESIEQLNQKLNATISSTEMAVSDAELGKLAEEDGWVLYMPHTTEASCEIGKTGGRRDTTWCTTRPDASNMFLQYSAQADANIVLFYVIKKGANAEKDPFAKMSVGFIDNEPKFDQGDGNVSVNADNKNLTKNKFEEVVGKDLANKFLRIMKEKSTSLGGEHPAKEEFRKLVQNPAAFKAKLDSFSDDENGRQLRSNFMETALGYKEISPDILKTLATDESVFVRLSVATNTKTPQETLRILATDKDSSVRENVAGNENTPPETLRILATDKDEYVRMVVANNPNTLPETLRILATDKDESVRQSVAKNPNILPEILRILATNESEYVRIGVAKNPNILPEILRILATDEDIRVRANVAKNPNTLPETLRILATDKERNVRDNVAGNENTPPEVLQVLATDKEVYVRVSVAKNLNTPPEVLRILATDKNKVVRQSVATNPNTLPETLRILATDENGYNIFMAVAKNPNTLPETLRILATNKSEYIREAVAKNPNTLPETLRILATDKDGRVRDNVAGNENTPPEVLQVLATDKDEYVRVSVAKNLNTPPETFRILATDKNEAVRMIVAKNSNTPPEVLQVLATDKGEYVRMEVAKNSNTPPEVLRILINNQKESDFIIRKAQENLIKRNIMFEALIFEKVLWKLLKRID